MIDKKEILQEEIDRLGVDGKTQANDDVKNIIILFRNELNVLTKEIDEFPEELQKKIRIKLNNLLDYIINIRRKN